MYGTGLLPKMLKPSAQTMIEFPQAACAAVATMTFPVGDGLVVQFGSQLLMVAFVHELQVVICGPEVNGPAPK